MVKRVVRACVEVNRRRGRQQRRWMDEVRDLLIGRGLSEKKEMLCNMTFEGGVVSEEGRPTVIVPLYKGKGERTKCKNDRGFRYKNICRDAS